MNESGRHVSPGDILVALRNLGPMLCERFAVKSIDLFGSVARGEQNDKSDVDLLVRFHAEPTFDQYFDLKYFLEDALGCRVDLVTPEGLKPRMRELISADLLHVA